MGILLKIQLKRGTFLDTLYSDEIPDVSKSDPKRPLILFSFIVSAILSP